MIWGFLFFIWAVSSWWPWPRATQRLPFHKLLNQGVAEGAIPFSGLPHFTLDLYLIMLSVKQGSIKYHFLCLWYDLTCDWFPVLIGNLLLNVNPYFIKTNNSLIINFANRHKKNTRVGMTWLKRWSIGNCARD